MLRDADVSKEVNDFITGHGSGDVAGSYGSGPSLETRQEALDRALSEETGLRRAGWFRSFVGWALREKLADGSPSDQIIGWCGLTATSHGSTPEILYGLARNHWGSGLATEAAQATIDWAFDGAVCDAIDAVIFGPLNPGSSAVAIKLGMRRTGTMRFENFLPDQQLGRDVLDYEIWRLRKGACQDFKALLFQAPFKAGLLVGAGVASEAETLSALFSGAVQHPDRGDVTTTEIERVVTEAFRRGVTECELDIFQVARSG